MVRLSLATAAVLAVVGTAQALPQIPAIVPGAYIVEYEDTYVLSRLTGSFVSDQDAGSFFNSIATDATKRMDLNFKLFKGASIQFKNVEKAHLKAAKVARMPAVKKMWPVRLYHVPDHTVHWVGNTSDSTEITKRDAVDKDEFSSHIMTQVNLLRDKGIVGTGIKIAIVDTGVDYKHPALGGCFGPGCLVSFGADLVGDAFNGSNTPVPDPDPLDMCNGHGTHVAGIIAAQSKNPYGIVGAAQGVTLGSFRVFGCSGDVPNDILIAAFNKAYEAGADIITASVGGPSGWSEDPWSVAVSRIVENGVPCTVSAGNDGSVGLFFASTAANGKGVTAIASVDNTLAPALLSNATFSVDNGTDQSFGYTVGTPGNWSVTLPLWAASYNTSNPADGCDEYPDSTPDLSGYIVLVRRGTCTFVQKATNAIKKGAKYLMVYNNAVGTASIDATGSGLQGLAMVTSDVGEKWIGYLKNGSSVVVSVTDPLKAPKFLVNFPNNATGGLASIYTSWGPTFEVDVKPQIASPGGNILSTYPQALGSYAVLSGTSMACPLAAAVYALIMNVRGTKDPKTIENVLSATSKPVPFSNGELTLPYLAPVAQQGAGLLQAYDAAYATTLLSVSSLSFNDTAHFTPERNFTISNTGNKEVTYQLRHVGALTAYTYLNDSTIFPDTFPNELSETHANLSFAPSDTLTIPAGQRRIVSVTLTPPSGLDAKRLPVYSGYIAINGSDESLLSLPYLGVVGSLRESVVLDPNGTYLSDSLSEKHVATAANHTFLLPPAGHANDTAYANRTALPTLITSFAMGTALLRVDLIPVGPSNASNATTSTTLFGEASLGPVLSTPVEYTSRGSSTNPWDGSLSDGTYAPAGWYKFSVQTLRIFGNREVAADYDVVETVPFEIRYSSLASNVTRRWY